MTKAKLKDCPNCGADQSDVILRSVAKVKMYYVGCLKCTKESEQFETPTEAVLAWNTGS